MRTWRSSQRTVYAVAAVAVFLAGCSSDDGRFDVGDSEDITCMEHQNDEPGEAYTGGDKGDTAAILAVFRYYVSNGSKDYCDGEPPTETDQKWAQLVVDLGGSPDSVAPILEGN